MVPSPPRRPLWLALAPAVFLCLWSGGYAISKVGLRHTTPFTFLALRYALVLAALAPAALILRPPGPGGLRPALHVMATGFLMQVGYFGCLYLALQWGMSAGSVAIIVCLQPLLVNLIAPWLVGEAVGWRRWLGLVLGLTGAVTVILSRQATGGETLPGVLAATLALFGITGGTLYEKRFGGPQHPVTANALQYAVGLGFALPVALMTEPFRVDPAPEFLWVMAYLVIANSLLSMTLLMAMIRAGEVSRVSSLFFLAPPLSALFAWPLLGEAMPPLGWLGMAVAAVGVIIAGR